MYTAPEVKDLEYEIATRLAKKLASFDRALPKVTVSDESRKWRMSSAWQKAVRRGDVNTALAMAAGLCAIDPGYVFYRITVLLFEDNAFADRELAEDLLWVVGQKMWRLANGGDKKIACYLTLKLAEEAKTRICCNTAVWTWLGALSKGLAPTFAKMPSEGLVKLAVDHESNLYSAVLALRYLSGVRPAREGEDVLPPRAKDMGAYLEAHTAIGVSKRDVYIGTKGMMRGGEGLPFVYGLMRTRFEKADYDISVDEMPPAIAIGAYPSWAFDMHCFEGKVALSYLLKSSSQLVPWLKSLGVPDDQLQFVTGEFMFFVEGGLLSPRYRWADDDLAELGCLQSVLEYAGMQPNIDMMTQGLKLARMEIEALNKARHRVIKV